MYGERELEAFVAVLDTGSVSLAAERLIRTQPTVSRQIASLERQVGASLFRRMPQGMVATYAGDRLEPMARDLVRRGLDADALAGRRAGQRSDRTGRLSGDQQPLHGADGLQCGVGRAR